MRGSLKLGRIAGIEIGVHYTWLLALFVFTWLFAQGYFPDAYPKWETYAYWVAGFLSTFLLFVSVLIHELAHSLVAKARGLPVSSITLFILGGVSNLSEEPEKPSVEFVMAIVGPLASLILGLIFWVIWYSMAGTWALPLFGVDIAVEKQTFGLAIAGFLAYANIALAIFNLLPGFPLDGGRVLRSIMWKITGNLVRATNIAAFVGRVFGWLFIGLGVWYVFFVGGGFLSGIWLVFIGWFINSAADNSRNEATLREHLSGVLVGQVMETDVESVHPETTVANLVQTVFIQKRRRAIPVADGDNLIGIVTISDVKGLPQERWQVTPVSQIMHRGPIHSVRQEDDLNTALKLIAQNDLNQVPVFSGSKMVGILSRADVINYLQLSQELNIKGKNKTRNPDI